MYNMGIFYAIYYGAGTRGGETVMEEKNKGAAGKQIRGKRK